MESSSPKSETLDNKRESDLIHVLTIQIRPAVFYLTFCMNILYSFNTGFLYDISHIISYDISQLYTVVNNTKMT